MPPGCPNSARHRLVFGHSTANPKSRILFALVTASLLAQNEIDNPTAAHMLSLLAAVIKDVGVCATGFFQSVCQYGQTVEGALIVDTLGQLRDGAVVPSKPTSF